MELSTKGAEFIGRFEGFSATLYNDPAGHCTIGYGHLVHLGKCDGSEPEEFKRGITRKQAAKLLRKDAASRAAAVEERVTVSLDQAQFDALVSFVYNLGVGNFGSSTLLKKLNQGQYAAVPSELDKWVKAGNKVLAGLVTRRKAEGVLFSHGDYGA